MMKKVFLMAAVAVATMTTANVNAQNFNKGDWFVGAQSTGLGLNISTPGKYTYGRGGESKSLNLDGRGGYFITKRLAVDGLAGFNWSKTEGSDNVCGFAVGAGFRYYPVGNLYARAGYKGVLDNTHSDNWFRSSVNFEVGYDVFVSDKIYFEPAVYYSNEFSYPERNDFGLSLGFGMRF